MLDSVREIYEDVDRDERLEAEISESDNEYLSGDEVEILKNIGPEPPSRFAKGGAVFILSDDESNEFGKRNSFMTAKRFHSNISVINCNNGSLSQIRPGYRS